MQQITEVTLVKAPAKEVWNFLTNLQTGDTYRKWHPRDHIKIICLKGNGEAVGSNFYAEEYIGKFVLRLPYTVTHSIPHYYLEYSASFPLSLLKVGKGYFKIEDVNSKTTKLTAYVEYGYELPILGKVLDKIVNFLIKKKHLEKHIHEEGENIKKLLEHNLRPEEQKLS